MKFRESALAHKYCKGKGIEIGGSAHNPFGLDTLNVDVTEAYTVFKEEEYAICGESLRVDIVASGDNLPFHDCSCDFVVSSHVIEHFTNPIKALLEWDRVLKPGGVIFMIVPHKDRTFDRPYPRTQLSHLVRDYLNDEKEPHTDGIAGHNHRWRTKDMVEVILWIQANMHVDWEIVDIQDRDDKVGNGFTIVIRKGTPQ